VPLDVQMPRMDGFAVLEAFHEQGILLPVIVMTVRGNVATAVRAMRAGAFDVRREPFDDAPPLAILAQAIERVAALSPREHGVLAGLLTGLPNKTIGYDLNFCVRTVEVHPARLMERLGAQTVAEVIRLRVLAGLR
jgi:two-component system, LuxR family, response regulator FixJ